MLSGPAAQSPRPPVNRTRITDQITASLNDLRTQQQAQAVPRCGNLRFTGVYSAVAKGEFNLPALGALNGPTDPSG